MNSQTTVAVSRIRKGAQGSVDWHIENWAADFDLLKDFASCTVVASTENVTSSETLLRFFLKEYYEPNPNDPYGKINRWLSLCAEVLSENQFPIAISIDIKGTFPAINLLDKRRRIESKGKSFTVLSKFIQTHNPESLNHKGNAVSWSEIPQSDQIQVNINVTIFEFNGELKENAARKDSPAAAAEASFLKDVKLMHNAEQNYSDLKIETKDNMTLSGHRFILAARSPVFRNMINERMEDEGFSGTIKVLTVNAKPLVVILYWMYTGELHENAGKVMDEVVEACIKFEMSNLLEILDEKLITICNTDNMLLLFQVAKKNGMSTARDQISEFIAQNIRTA